jgi:anaerobic magnesium-protoporphyrin IX monomethyl ester cyclase
VVLLKEKYGARHFLFGDECMTVRKSFVHDLMKELKKQNITFEAYSRVDTVDDDILAWLRDAGCRMLGFGFESGSQKILDLMNKRVTVEQMREAYILAKKYIPVVSGTFIVGYPGEDAQSILDTLSFMNSIKYYRVPFHLSPYPGTPVFEDNKQKILDKFGSWHNFLLRLNDAYDFVINLTDWTDDEYFRAVKIFGIGRPQ